jgi:hypothetical protein
MKNQVEKWRENKRNFLKRQREKGLCLECVNPVMKGKSRCENHILARQQKEAQNRLDAASNGLCYYCYKSPKMEHHKTCETCYLKRVSLRHFGTMRFGEELKKMFQSQNGKCALSGLPIVIGQNADLDHITPKLQGGRDELNNVQWVLDIVNNFKSGMLEKDFFNLIQNIYETMRSRY